MTDTETREREILLLCARRRLSPVIIANVTDLVRCDIDWEALLTMAAQHGMLPLVCWHLRSHCVATLPALIKQELHAEIFVASARNSAMLSELVTILRLFEDNGIAALPYKGPAVAVHIYGDVALRRFSDLDVVVRKQHLAAAREVLVRHGYHSPDRLSASQDAALNAAHGHYTLVREGCAAPVELHWRFAPDCFGSIDVDEALQRAETMKLDGVSVPTLSHDDLLLTLCIHGGKHAWERLEWICGVAEMLRSGRTNFDHVLLTARRLHSIRMVSVGLRLAQHLLDAPLPPDVERRITADPEVDRLVAQVESQLFAERSNSAGQGRAAEWRFQMRSRERLRDRARFLYHVTMLPTPAEWSAVRLGDRLLPLYRIIRPLRLLGNYGYGAVKRAVTSRA